MVTANVPTNKLRGMFFLGFTTSPAVKVMLFHASEVNNEPTCEIPMAAINANLVMALFFKFVFLCIIFSDILFVSAVRV